LCARSTHTYCPRMRWLLFVTVLPGCSFIFVHGPPEDHEKLRYFDCDSGGSAMTADIAGGTLSGLMAVTLASSTDESGEPPPRSAPITFGALSAVYLASAVYGGVNRSRCNSAKQELSARIARDYERHAQRVKELEQPLQQPAPSGCSKDVECKGERICVATQCVDPPIPSAETLPSGATPTPSSVAPAPDPPRSHDSQDSAPSTPRGNLGQFPLLSPSQR
jgi:hypothetical protein